MSEIKVVKLNTGADLIATVSKNQDGTTTLLKALRIKLTPTGNPEAPLAPSFDVAFQLAKDAESVTLKDSAILYELEPHDQILDLYRTAITGLLLPPSGIAR